ncbi:putative P450 monooxygenase [Diaporthe sp. PMI_573]|nr:putative P450 monooxygenase [Diaporthaceae sp. PMI_573]
MIPPSIVVLCLITAIIGIRATVTSYLGLKVFKGPWTAAWSRAWFVTTQLSGRMHLHFAHVNRRYGPTARIAPNTLITEDLDLIRRIHAVSSKFTKGEYYESFQLHPDYDSEATQGDEQLHAKVRALLAPGFSFKENPFLEDHVDEMILALLNLISRKFTTSPIGGSVKKADIATISQFLTLDVVSRVTFSREFGFLKDGEDVLGYRDTMITLMRYLMFLSVFPEVCRFIKAVIRVPFIKRHVSTAIDNSTIGKMTEFSKEVVQERFGDNPVEKKDMLQSFVRHGRGQKELEAESLQQIVAGTDSTATTLRMALHYISTSPGVLERLLAEFDGAIAAGRVSRPIVKNSEALTLPYLQACIRETLRMYPPVLVLMAKQVPHGGIEIDIDGQKRFLPDGTQIGWNPYRFTRRTDIFGPDVDVFRPDRWLPQADSEEEMERIGNMVATVNLCFSYGRFSCLGKSVAFMELNKAIPEVRFKKSSEKPPISGTT